MEIELFLLIIIMQGIHSVINYHNSSVAKALFDLFPEIGLQKSKLLVAKCISLFIISLLHYFIIGCLLIINENSILA